MSQIESVSTNLGCPVLIQKRLRRLRDHVRVEFKFPGSRHPHYSNCYPSSVELTMNPEEYREDLDDPSDLEPGGAVGAGPEPEIQGYPILENFLSDFFFTMKIVLPILGFILIGILLVIWTVFYTMAMLVGIGGLYMFTLL